MLSRNRLPNQSDNLSHWSDILHWRQIHFKAIVNVYENVNQSDQVNISLVCVLYIASHNSYTVHTYIHILYV